MLNKRCRARHLLVLISFNTGSESVSSSFSEDSGGRRALKMLDGRAKKVAGWKKSGRRMSRKRTVV